MREICVTLGLSFIGFGAILLYLNDAVGTYPIAVGLVFIIFGKDEYLMGRGHV